MKRNSIIFSFLLLTGCDDPFPGYEPASKCIERNIEQGACLRYEYFCNKPLVLENGWKQRPRCFMPGEQK